MKTGLNNPIVAAAVVTNPQVQKIATKSIDLLFTVAKIGVFGLVGYIVYKKVFKGFKKERENPNYTPSNVSSLQAKAKAESIYNAMFGINRDFTQVFKNLDGVNRNGFIRIYNEFGARRDAAFKKMTMTEWFYDQFSKTDISRLKFITNNAF